LPRLTNPGSQSRRYCLCMNVGMHAYIHTHYRSRKAFSKVYLGMLTRMSRAQITCFDQSTLCPPPHSLQASPLASDHEASFSPTLFLFLQSSPLASGLEASRVQQQLLQQQQHEQQQRQAAAAATERLRQEEVDREARRQAAEQQAAAERKRQAERAASQIFKVGVGLHWLSSHKACGDQH